MTARRAPRLGFRGELLLLPLAALLLVLTVSAFTLFSYRNALELFAEERRAEAARLAGAAAAGVAAGAPPAAEELRRLAPRAERLLLIDAAGRVAAAWGEPAEDAGDPLAALGAARDLAGPVGIGPGAGLPDGIVAGFAPLGPPEARRILRVDLDAGPLAAQLAGLRVLLPVALAADAAVVILMLLFLRHLLTPFDALLERARRLGGAGSAGGASAGTAFGTGGGGPEGGDEIAFLVRTFERAVEALAAPPSAAAAADAGGEEADIAALSRTLARSLESGVLLLDAAGAVLALNAVGAELLGVDRPAVGTPASRALAAHPDLARAVDAAVAGREGVQRREIDLAAPGAGGAPRTLGLTVHPLRRDDGAVRGYLVLFADLTESRRRADADRLADRLARLGELAAGFAHELRNGLATLRGYLTLIERARGEERAADYLEEIRREADHLERVLTDFLAFARPGTARVEPVPAAALARRAAADPALGGVGVEVTVAPAAEDAVIAGDPQLLERALRNLLLNAARAERDAGRRGPVALSVERVGGGVELAVADRGPGVPAAVRERLFHPFATGRPDGVGLGLALTHRIATLHGGALRLEDRPGGGTRATLAFPPDVFVTISNDPPDRSGPSGGT